MVESSAGAGGVCRCACREDFHHPGEEEEEDGGRGCCSPQVFTSVLLGVLACVLMTGGVFLAFHRWDPLWLIVSGIGVVLILIGSVLHCCSSMDSSQLRTRGRHPGKGGCCGRPPEHHLHGHHLVANNGSLTEQLLPLSNARSVSQLSLNMLPGYFPPVVTTYGIEQHSAVVQNINRIVQQQQLQQQQLQQQGPGGAGPQSPGAQSGAGGKSFILLSLPGDSTQANIQNLVATVYQLEGSSAGDSPSAESSANPPPVTTSTPPSPAATTIPTPPLFKSVEVQTCNMWPNTTSGPGLANNVSASTSTESAIADPQPSTSAVTQTEDTPIDLMDCSATDIPTPRICDNDRSQTSTADSSTSALTNIPASSSSDVLVDISESAITQSHLQSALVVTIPESAEDDNLLNLAPPPSSTDVLIDEVSASCSVDVSSDVLIDISDSGTSSSSEPSEIAASITPSSDSVASVNLDSVENTNPECNSSTHIQSVASTSGTHIQSVASTSSTHIQGVASTSSTHIQSVASTSNHLQVGGVGGSELSLSNLSDMDGEVDDSELIGRSSPPPSYDDATHEGENAIGAFGLAYGTI